VSDDSRLMSLPPFPPDYRASGLLLHVTSLPSQTHPGAAASLREGLDETLTLQRLGVTGALYRTLRGTNAIENLNGASSATSCGVCMRDNHCLGTRQKGPAICSRGRPGSLGRRPYRSIAMMSALTCGLEMK
jgi:hypothetical protein